MRAAPPEGRDPLRSFGIGVALLVLLVALLLLPAAGQAPLERAEIYFVDGARGMVESGDYLVPRYRGETFFDKPPLTYWLIAAAFRHLGFSMDAARLVPAVAAILAVLATIGLGVRLFDQGTALAGGLALATTAAFMSFGRIAMSDMLLTLWTTLGIGLGVNWIRGGYRPQGLGVALGAVLGLGFLTKGPVALLFVGLGLLALLGGRPLLASLPRAAGVGIGFSLVGLPWFALVAARLGWEPLRYFFLRENLERFAGEMYDAERSPLYYLGVLLALGLPWSPILAVSLWRLWRDRKQPRSPVDQAALGLWRIVALMLVPLSLSRGKIDYYLLPLWPALSLVTAWTLRGPWSRSERAFGRVLLLGVAGGLLAVPAANRLVPPAWLPEPHLQSGAALALWILAATLVAGALWFRPVILAGSLAASSALVFFLVSVCFVPAVRRAQPNDAIVNDILRERSFEPELRLVYCEDPTRVARDLLFEARLATIERCDLWNPAASRYPFLILVPEDQRETLRTATRFVGRYPYLPATLTTLRRLVQGVSPGTLVLLANYATGEPESLRRARRDRKHRVQERERRGAPPTGGSSDP